MTIEAAGVLLALFVACVALLKSIATSQQAERDARYSEWHMRSLEQRKQDTPDTIAERERMMGEP